MKSQVAFAKIEPSLSLRVRPFIVPTNVGARIGASVATSLARMFGAV